MRVLHFSSEYGSQMKGGLGTHVVALAQAASAAGAEVTVLVYTLEPARVVADGAIGVHFVPVEATRFNARRASMEDEVLAVNAALVGYGRRLFSRPAGAPQIIHCHDWYFFPAAKTLGREYGVPVVATVHMLHDPVVRFWGVPLDPEITRRERAMCQEADSVITVSESMRDLVRRTHATPGERLHVVYNGFDARLFQANARPPAQMAALRRSVAEAGDRIVLFAGRLDPQKGISALFASAARVCSVLPGVRYLIVGATHTRKDAQMMRELTAEHRALEGRVKLLGAVPRKQLALLYSLADVAVVPSLYEPFGYAAVEPMAAGVPVIATDVGGLSEIIDDGSTGLLVPVHTGADGLRRVDIESLAAAQLRLLGDVALAEKLRRAARARVLERFTSERMSAATLEVYRRTRAASRASLSSSSSHSATESP
jgi:alpha-maltose-1-phosphate synthase